MTYITVYDKVNNSVTTEEISLANTEESTFKKGNSQNVVNSFTLDLNALEEQSNNIGNAAARGIYEGLISYKITTFWDIKYFVHKFTLPTSYSWTLECDRGAKRDIEENSSNASTLESYRLAVNNVNKKQVEAVAVGGTALATTIAAGAAAATGVGAIVSLVTAIGGSITVAYLFWDAKQSANDANYFFERV